MRAKKSLGQHFLTNQSVARQIVSAISDPSLVMEIGPGPGILTDLLADICDQLILVEKDDRFAAELKRRYASGSVTVVHDDVLRADFGAVSGGAQFALVGNFPYNISSQIVFRMLHFQELIPEMIGMFQLEMAQRIVAGPGSKAYSVIG
ncbi:MAG: rRNA adenine dimethyltransferase family protein, partial [Saprospiraceae bacterium]|nr:rRNA adenine dimethyltransferase family protein [Saprospiraceae bacterium]